MPPTSVNYYAVLADLEAQHAVVNQAIAHLSRLFDIGVIPKPRSLVTRAAPPQSDDSPALDDSHSLQATHAPAQHLSVDRSAATEPPSAEAQKSVASVPHLAGSDATAASAHPPRDNDRAPAQEHAPGVPSDQHTSLPSHRTATNRPPHDDARGD